MTIEFVVSVIALFVAGLAVSTVFGTIALRQRQRKRSTAASVKVWEEFVAASQAHPESPASRRTGKLIIFGDGGVLLALTETISRTQHEIVRQELDQWRLNPSQGIVIGGVDVEIIRPSVVSTDVVAVEDA